MSPCPPPSCSMVSSSSCSFDEIDDTLLDCGLLKESVGRKTNYLMSNSFAFGGNNTSIIIGKVDE